MDCLDYGYINYYVYIIHIIYYGCVQIFKLVS